MGPRKTVDDRRYNNPDNDPRGPYVLSDVTAPFERPPLIYEINGYLPPAGRSWRYTAERMRVLQEEGRIISSPTGHVRLKRYLSEVSSPVEESIEPPAPLTHELKLELIVRTAMKAIAVLIAKYPKSLRKVEWRDLERIMREVFEKLGFETELTRSGKDGGFDLRLGWDDGTTCRTSLVEVKHWLESGKKVGSHVLSALVDVVAKEGNGTSGLLLSSSGFTKNIYNGRAEVEQHVVRIGGENKIVSLCQNYVQSSEGIWSPTADLSEMLLEGTW